MTEESGRRVGGSNALTGRVLVLVLDLRVGGFLRAGHQQSGDIDDSLELAHAVKEIEHRVIGTIKFHLERQFAIKIFRSEEHTSELQSPDHLVCRLLLEKKKKKKIKTINK